MISTTKKNGVTLPELLITIAIISVLVISGLPRVSLTLQKIRVLLATNALHNAINLTRSEAIAKNRRIDLIPIDGRYWENGWVIFVDSNNNQRMDRGETPIYSHEALHSSIRITTHFTDLKKHYIAYNGNGRTQTNASSQQPQVGTIALTAGDYVRRIHLNFSGRARVAD